MKPGPLRRASGVVAAVVIANLIALFLNWSTLWLVSRSGLAGTPEGHVLVAIGLTLAFGIGFACVYLGDAWGRR